MSAQFKTDLAVLKSTVSADSVVQDLEFDGESTLSLTFIMPTLARQKMNLVVPEGYPRDEYMLIVPSGSDGFSGDTNMQTLPSGNLVDVVNNLQNKFWKVSAVDWKIDALKAAAPAKPKNELKQSRGGLRRSQLAKSTGGDSTLSGSYGDDDDYGADDDDYGYLDDEDGDPEAYEKAIAMLEDTSDRADRAVIQERVLSDVTAARTQFGVCGLYTEPATGDFLVRLVIDTSFLGKWQAEAWGVDKTMPIIVELSFTMRYIFNKKLPPKVLKAYQAKPTNLDTKSGPAEQKEFGQKWYLMNRLADALRLNWVKNYRGADDDAAPSPANTNAAASSSAASPAFQWAQERVKIMELGFGLQLAEHALRHTKGQVETAVVLLTDPDARAKMEETMVGQEQQLSQQSAPVGVGSLENFFAESSTFLCCVIAYLSARLRHASDNCIICDEPLQFPGLKPTICNKILCQHSFDTYGLGVSLLADVQRNAKILDLNITWAVACSRNKRSNGADVFEPFPETVEAEEKDKLGKIVKTWSFMKPGGVKDTDLVGVVCSALPPVSVMAQYPELSSLKAYLDTCHPLAYPFCRWLMVSSRCHISPLPVEHHIKEMNTPHQFYLVSDLPKKNTEFLARKAEIAKKKGGKGSFMSWHGSAVGNWHCISRMGLKNYSNTNKMSAGAAYGAGIYTALTSSTSFSYMGQGQSWEKSSMWPESAAGRGGTMGCIAMVEILDERGTDNIHSSGDINVIKDEASIVTRFFFVYAGSTSGFPSVKAEDLKLPPL